MDDSLAEGVDLTLIIKAKSPERALKTANSVIETLGIAQGTWSCEKYWKFQDSYRCILRIAMPSTLQTFAELVQRSEQIAKQLVVKTVSTGRFTFYIIAVSEEIRIANLTWMNIESL